jgi:ferredoxin
MIKATRKSLGEIFAWVEGYRRLLIVGCGGCVSVCLAGGQKESDLLGLELEARSKLSQTRLTATSYTLERQCNEMFLPELDEMAEAADAVISLACGAGVQNLADRFPRKPVFSAVNTMFIGIDRAVGVYEERCRACGDCMLSYTGGICPVTRCAKSIFNGPCGGAQKGKCEADPDQPCAWLEIYERLKQQGRLELIIDIRPVPDWRNRLGILVQPAYQRTYTRKSDSNDAARIR